MTPGAAERRMRPPAEIVHKAAAPPPTAALAPGTGVAALIFGGVVVKLRHRLDLHLAQDLAVEDRDFDLAAAHVLFDQYDPVEPARSGQSGVEVLLTVDDRYADRRSLARGLYDKRKADALHVLAPR